MPDIKSTLVAGAIGAVLMVLIGYIDTQPNSTPFSAGNLATGFAIGAGVQITVRLIGVS